MFYEQAKEASRNMMGEKEVESDAFFLFFFIPLVPSSMQIWDADRGAYD